MRSNESAVTATDKVDSSITADFLQQENYIPIPDSVLAVVKVYPVTDKLTQNLFDVRYQLRLNDLYDFSSTSIIHYEMTMRHLDFLDHILTMNGETIYQQALDEITKLEEEMKLGFELPVNYMVG